ncbi:MAG: di-trans,poly-cis-decaprenylcistransferase [Treponema sp.]|nr:di-trans,poly-cis-decaprenylcistransferase [Treponema sp.]
MAVDKNNLPTHVAVIMDGNGRWAARQNKIRSNGHAAGLTRAKEVVGAAAELGIPYITLYIFSTENWKRTEEEVGYLMGLICKHLRAEFDFYKKNSIRLLHIGDSSRLPKDVQTDLHTAIAETAAFTGTTLVMAINYGGRDEIVRGVKQLVANNTAACNITEQTIASSFDVPNLPDVDLLIRTGGEKRLSNFLLWHASYAELLFTDTLWPDYTVEEFYADIEKFKNRSRRFGAIQYGEAHE